MKTSSRTKGAGKGALSKERLSYQKRLMVGFAKVESDLDWLMEAFCEH